jgi:hypothetical protein
VANPITRGEAGRGLTQPPEVSQGGRFNPAAGGEPGVWPAPPLLEVSQVSGQPPAAGD